MSKHTEAPWVRWVGHESIFSKPSTNARTHITAQKCVCALPELKEWLDDGHSEEEWFANARLIESAPALLEELRALCDQVREGRGMDTLAARTLIGKIEGKS